MTVAVKAGTSSVSHEEARNAANLCLSSQKGSPGADPLSEDLIRLQTLILMTIADELSGPLLSRAGTWLGSAVALANSLHLQHSGYSEGSDDSNLRKLLRRAWLSLVILDRWHAAAKCTATLIHDEDVSLVPADHIVLGSNSYHLLRKFTKSSCMIVSTFTKVH